MIWNKLLSAYESAGIMMEGVKFVRELAPFCLRLYALWFLENDFFEFQSGFKFHKISKSSKFLIP